MPKKCGLSNMRGVVVSALGIFLLLSGCNERIDPDSYFNPATDEVKVRACIDRLKPMIEDIKRKKLDQGYYVPGSELTVKNTTFRYYQGLVRNYEHLPTYLTWKSLTLSEKEQASIFYCVLPDNFISHETSIQKEITDTEVLFKRKLSYQTMEESREDGLKSRDEWDKIVRDAIPDRRKKLLAAATSHTMSNSHGVRIDTYIMKSGPSVVCSTTVHPTAGPNMNCDNEP